MSQNPNNIGSDAPAEDNNGTGVGGTTRRQTGRPFDGSDELTTQAFDPEQREGVQAPLDSNQFAGSAGEPRRNAAAVADELPDEEVADEVFQALPRGLRRRVSPQTFTPAPSRTAILGSVGVGGGGQQGENTPPTSLSASGDQGRLFLADDAIGQLSQADIQPRGSEGAGSFAVVSTSGAGNNFTGAAFNPGGGAGTRGGATVTQAGDDPLVVDQVGQVVGAEPDFVNVSFGDGETLSARGNRSVVFPGDLSETPQGPREVNDETGVAIDAQTGERFEGPNATERLQQQRQQRREQQRREEDRRRERQREQRQQQRGRDDGTGGLFSGIGETVGNAVGGEAGQAIRDAGDQLDRVGDSLVDRPIESVATGVGATGDAAASGLDALGLDRVADNVTEGIDQFDENVDERVQRRRQAEMDNDLGDAFGLGDRGEAILNETNEAIAGGAETGAQVLGPGVAVASDVLTAPGQAALEAGERLGIAPERDRFDEVESVLGRAQDADSASEFFSDGRETNVEREAEEFLDNAGASAQVLPGGATAANEVFETGAAVATGQATAGEAGAAGGRVATGLAESAANDPVSFAGDAVFGLPAGAATRPLSPIRGRRVSVPDERGGSTTVGVASVEVPDVAKGTLGDRRVNIAGRTGLRPQAGTPSVDLDSVDLQRLGGRADDAAEQIGRTETDVFRESVRDTEGADPAAPDRLAAADELIGRARGADAPDVDASGEEIVQQAQAVPDDAAADIADVLGDVDATVKGSAATRAQLDDFRQPNDLDVIVDEQRLPDARQQLSGALEGSNADVDEVFDFAERGEARGLEAGEELKRGARAQGTRQPSGAGFDITDVRDELVRKSGASVFTRGRGAAGTPDIDVGPEPRRPGRADTRIKDVADAESIARDLLGDDVADEFASEFENLLGPRGRRVADGSGIGGGRAGGDMDGPFGPGVDDPGRFTPGIDTGDGGVRPLRGEEPDPRQRRVLDIDGDGDGELVLRRGGEANGRRGRSGDGDSPSPRRGRDGDNGSPSLRPRGGDGDSPSVRIVDGTDESPALGGAPSGGSPSPGGAPDGAESPPVTSPPGASPPGESPSPGDSPPGESPTGSPSPPGGSPPGESPSPGDSPPGASPPTSPPPEGSPPEASPPSTSPPPGSAAPTSPPPSSPVPGEPAPTNPRDRDDDERDGDQDDGRVEFSFVDRVFGSGIQDVSADEVRSASALLDGETAVDDGADDPFNL